MTSNYDRLELIEYLAEKAVTSSLSSDEVQILRRNLKELRLILARGE